MCTAAQSIKLIGPTEKPGVGDTFYITIEMQNVSGQPEKPANVPGAKVLYLQQRKQAVNTVIVNGQSRTTSSSSYALTLRAETPGTYKFGPITIGGVSSNVLTYHIGAQSTQQQAPDPASQPAGGTPALVNAGGSDLILKATVSNSSPYEQQGVVYTVTLYTTYAQIFDWISTNAPSFGNCTFEPVEVPVRKLQPETLNGKQYWSAPIARYILYPTQSGQATIKGNSYTGSVARQMVYNDPVFGQMSKIMPEQVTVSANDIVLNVRPLPDAAGHDDICGVGDFTVKAELVSKTVKAHQAAIVRYTVSGTGNLSFVSLPDLAAQFPPELKFLKSEANIKKTIGESNQSGSVTFDCTFIPQKEGDYSIPELKFHFFNASEGNWYVRSTPAIAVKVGEGSPTHEHDVTLSFRDGLKPLKAGKRDINFMIDASLFFLWYIIPLLFILIVVLAYRKYMQMAADTSKMKQRKANRMARRRLRAAEKYMKKGNADLFYDEMLHSLWGYLSDKLNMPTSELNRDNVTDALVGRNVPVAQTDELIALLDDSEFAKYGSLRDADMQQTYDRACHIIESLEESITNAEKK